VTAQVLEAPAAASSAALTDLAEIAALCGMLAEAKLPVAIDVETGYHGDSRPGVSLHAEENFIVSVQLTNDMAWARMIPLGFDSGENAGNRECAALLWALLQVRDDAGLTLAVAHGAIAELRWLARWFLRNLWDHPLFGQQVIAARGYWTPRSCTLLESFAEGVNASHGLKAMTALPPDKGGFGYQMRELNEGPDSLLGLHLGRTPTKFEHDSVRFNVFDPTDPSVISYACEDVVYALGHHLRRWPKVRAGFPYRVEMAVLPVVCQMADDGLQYDWDLMREKAREAREFADLLLAEVIDGFEVLAGEKLSPNFNFGSSAQLVDLFYNKCKMPCYHYTDGGKSGVPKPSTDAKKALPRLIAEYPAVARYNQWRRLNTLLDNFLDIYEAKYSWALDGRAHPLLVQHGTIAGRFSCENPNAQQPPGKYHIELSDSTVFDFNFRDAIIPAQPGQRTWWELVLIEAGWVPPQEADETPWYILGFDYSQIELRVLAAEAGETELLAAFERGEDVHSLTASRMLGIPLESVTEEQRQDKGKRMNFAIGYGLSEHGMAEQTGKPIEECRELFAAYHRAYPRLKPYSRRIVAEARRRGYVITKFGRRVTLHDIWSDNKKVRSAEERTAGNCVIQGPATGDYVKRVMVRAVKALAKAGLADKVRLIMNVHDALEFEVRRDVAPADVIAVLVPAVIVPVDSPGVPWPTLVADWHIGESWGKKREIEVLADGSVKLKVKKKPVPAPPPQPAPAAPAPVPGPPAAPAGPPRKVIVVAKNAPTRDQAVRLAAYMRSLPGGNTVEVQLPDGPLAVGFGCGLTPEHDAQVSVILGGASVHYALDSVDADALAAGLDL
jgi:DNA polymerase I-like protein with 3'-5' exonuclease and polymerase domains